MKIYNLRISILLYSSFFYTYSLSFGPYFSAKHFKKRIMFNLFVNFKGVLIDMAIM